jgi:hypothetical protein
VHSEDEIKINVRTNQFFGEILTNLHNSKSDKSTNSLMKNKNEQMIYLIKIKGKAKIPDYVQIRDADFTLIGYFRPGRNEKTVKSLDLSLYQERLEKCILEMPFGKITPFQL